MGTSEVASPTNPRRHTHTSPTRSRKRLQAARPLGASQERTFLSYERAHTRTHSTSQSIAFPGAESVLSAPRQYISLWPASDFTER